MSTGFFHVIGQIKNFQQIYLRLNVNKKARRVFRRVNFLFKFKKFRCEFYRSSIFPIHVDAASLQARPMIKLTDT